MVRLRPRAAATSALRDGTVSCCIAPAGSLTHARSTTATHVARSSGGAVFAGTARAHRRAADHARPEARADQQGRRRQPLGARATLPTAASPATSSTRRAAIRTSFFCVQRSALDRGRRLPATGAPCVTGPCGGSTRSSQDVTLPQSFFLRLTPCRAERDAWRRLARRSATDDCRVGAADHPVRTGSRPVSAGRSRATPTTTPSPATFQRRAARAVRRLHGEGRRRSGRRPCSARHSRRRCTPANRSSPTSRCCAVSLRR